MPEIITRAQAKARGLNRYFNGTPCSRAGHISERLVVNGGCYACHRMNSDRFRKSHQSRRNELQKNRRRKNPEREAEYRKKYRDKSNAARRIRRERNKDHEKNIRLRKYRENPRPHIEAVKRCYDNGPSNPKGEGQWLRKSQAYLRSLRRVLRKPNLDHSHLLNEAPRR